MPAHFIGTVSVTWLEHPGEDREMRLNQRFAFEDAAGLVWSVKRGAVIDGASIPKIFWTSFGSPFVGDYRRASVVHDWFCETRTRTSAATHHMFFEACVAGGVGTTKAKIMYTMVKTFGPSWTTLSADLEINGAMLSRKGRRIDYTHAMADEDFDDITRWIETANPTIEAIDLEIERRSTELLAIPADTRALSVESF